MTLEEVADAVKSGAGALGRSGGGGAAAGGVAGGGARGGGTVAGGGRDRIRGGVRFITGELPHHDALRLVKAGMGRATLHSNSEH